MHGVCVWEREDVVCARVCVCVHVWWQCVYVCVEAVCVCVCVCVCGGSVCVYMCVCSGSVCVCVCYTGKGAGSLLALAELK